MGNRHFSLLAAVCILFALAFSGCSSGSGELPQTEPAPVPATQAVTEAVTEAATEIPTEQSTIPAETDPETMPTEAEPETTPTEAEPETTPTEAEPETAPAQEPALKGLPYLQKVTFADQSIYDGPGYDYVFAGTVKEAGTYTIVEEARDAEDNLWGRLKSGAGWIDLTQVRRRMESSEALSVNYADDLLLSSGNFHHCVADPSDFAIQVAIRAHEPLTDVTLFAMEFYETMELGEPLYSLPRLDPDKPLVANLGFPGDMTTYAIRFTDSSGAVNCRCIYISGRNSALEQYEYES